MIIKQLGNSVKNNHLKHPNLNETIGEDFAEDNQLKRVLRDSSRPILSFVFATSSDSSVSLG